MRLITTQMNMRNSGSNAAIDDADAIGEMLLAMAEKLMKIRR